ncbi:hypothetical protein FXO38_24326 [Capsicum annuum]|uniref:Uncharacterized protein n=1 Tax=Capsicum annuum TaxID=4072 RepID=A0A2G2ZIG9_CAPAN|nr:hypothetical protein FXO38_24326 [Capsicum annuum]KAF3671305.1 hypothetical protein FXO37_08117 [Capsicum annuum]PHT81807.1 hypothetical protein T459_14822 [Capsicum annuum]
MPASLTKTKDSNKVDSYWQKICDLEDLMNSKHGCSISKSNLSDMSAGSARRRLSKLYSTFLFCLSEMVLGWFLRQLSFCPVTKLTSFLERIRCSVGIISTAREDWVPSTDSSVAEVKDERIPKVSVVPKGRSDSESLHTVERAQAD